MYLDQSFSYVKEVVRLSEREAGVRHDMKRKSFVV